MTPDDFYWLARREVARVLALARAGINRELYPKPVRMTVTYGGTAVNTHERYEARRKAWQRNPGGWKSRARA
jgi:hypothetical protein